MKETVDCLVNSSKAEVQRDPLFLEGCLWTTVLTVCFFVFYGGSSWITFLRDRHNPASVGTFFFQWERAIPFVPWMMIPYISVDVFYFFGPFACINRQQMRAHGRRVLAALVIGASCFMLFPLKMGPGFVHPPVGGFLGLFFGIQDGLDRPYNLAPSLHVAFRSLLLVVYLQHLRGWLWWLAWAWFVLIVISTLCVWQHHVIDLPTGQALAMLCLWIFPDRRTSTRFAGVR